jgi:hypothetical protein
MPTPRGAQSSSKETYEHPTSPEAVVKLGPILLDSPRHQEKAPKVSAGPPASQTQLLDTFLLFSNQNQAEEER